MHACSKYLSAQDSTLQVGNDEARILVKEHRLVLQQVEQRQVGCVELRVRRVLKVLLQHQAHWCTWHLAARIPEAVGDLIPQLPIGIFVAKHEAQSCITSQRWRVGLTEYDVHGAFCTHAAWTLVTGDA